MEIDSQLRSEAIRVFRRYAVELVEGLSLCPWAFVSRRDGHVREVVITEPELDLARVARAIDELSADPAIEIGIVLFPRAEVDRATFERFVIQVRTHDESLRRGFGEAWAMAEFHPDAPAVLTPDGAFTNFVRRTPDPTIQLVRQSALERVRRGDNHGSGYFDIKNLTEDTVFPPVEPPLHERVLEQNREHIARAGVAEVAARFAEIRADRDASYAKILGSTDRDAARRG
jgi:hypothetical protein